MTGPEPLRDEKIFRMRFVISAALGLASMQVGRDRPRGDAVMILSVDDPVPEAIQTEIRRIPGMADVLTVTL